MAKIRYTLTAQEDHVKTEVVDGKTVLTFEWDCENHDVDHACSSGESQGDALWEIFHHDFQAFEDDGTQIEYDQNTGEKV